MEQLAIAVDDSAPTAGARRKGRPRPKVAKAISEQDPIAEVLVDVNAAAVDHTFDYLVPAEFDSAVVPGCRVRVRFAGRLVNGFVLRRRSVSEHVGKLAAINKVLGPDVLIPEIAELARAVADRYAGTANEVLREAVPPRHARTEAKFVEQSGALLNGNPPELEEPSVPATLDWAGYEDGVQLIEGLATGRVVRASLIAALADSGPDLVADLVAQADARAIVVVPDGADVDRFAEVMGRRFGGRVARLTSDQKPQDRYEAFLRVRVGEATVVVGTRNCVFAPVAGLRLIVVWDDGDESLVQARSPGWHAREVAALRSLENDTSVVLAGYSRSAEAARMVKQRWLVAVEPGREARRRSARVLTSASGRADDPAAHSRIPRFAWEAVSRGVAAGPVLVQVGRAGYVPALACEQCRAIVKCTMCEGPMGQRARKAGFQCRWCGHPSDDLACAECGGTKFRAVRIGSERTAEELRASFPDVPVIVSDSINGVQTSVGTTEMIVVATVGAEPHAVGRYQAAVLLDGDAQLVGAHLRSEEQLVRRWFNAAALVKGESDGGVVAVTADASHRAVQALVRSDPAGWAERELSERQATGLPPVSRCAAVTGPADGVAQFVQACDLDAGWRVLGPSPIEGRGKHDQHVRCVILAPHREGARLAQAVKGALVLGAGGSGESRVVVRMDPPSVL